MKRVITGLFILLTSCLYAQEGITVKVQTHKDFTETIPERPYGEDDVSYGIFWDTQDGNGAWRLGVNYSDDLSGIEGADSVITPQISLVALDGVWEFNVSALIDYVDLPEGSEWGDVYFDVSLGLNISLSTSTFLGVHARYPFEDLDDLGDISTSDLEYALTLSIRL
jgi:hypothetical protein